MTAAQTSPKEMEDVLLTDVSAERASFEASTRIYSEESTDFRRRRFKMAWTDVGVNVPIHMPDVTDRIFSFQLKIGMRDFHTNVLLPNTISEFPDPLYDVGLGATYRLKTQGGWNVGVNFNVAAPSDIPFADGHDVRVGANVYARMPASRGDDEWLFYVHYLSTRDYLHEIPLPGVGYIWKAHPKPHQNFTFLIGAPLAMADLRFSEKTYFKASYLLLRKLSAEGGRQFTPELTQFVGFDWDQNDFYRKSNSDIDDKLTYHEKRALGGFRYAVSPDAFIELGAGYAFQRYWYEGLDYGDRKFNHINVDGGPFAHFKLSMLF